MITSLSCTICGTVYPADDRLHCEKCGPDDGILDGNYDYERAKKTLTKDALASRPFNHWRYHEVLPITEGLRLPTLQVGWTPVYEPEPLAKHYGIGKLFLKDDGRNPTSSFKDRASSMGVVKAMEFGYDTIACASTGNAASSLAGFAANVGLRSYIFVPERAPEPKVTQLLVFGANVMRVKGTYDQAYDLCRQATAKHKWYSRNCATNAYLVEGKKTCGLEIGEQMGDQIPDWVAVSVGDGCSIAGVWKGIKEMHALGIIPRLPRMLGVQAEGSPAVARQFEAEGEPPLGNYPATTIADSICVGVPRNWRKAVRAVRDSHGAFVTVTDDEILDALSMAPRLTGVFGEPAGIAGLAGIRLAIEKGIIGPKESVLTVVTGNGLKDVKTAASAVGAPYSIAPTLEDLDRILASPSWGA